MPEGAYPWSPDWLPFLVVALLALIVGLVAFAWRGSPPGRS